MGRPAPCNCFCEVPSSSESGGVIVVPSDCEYCVAENTTPLYWEFTPTEFVQGDLRDPDYASPCWSPSQSDRVAMVDFDILNQRHCLIQRSEISTGFQVFSGQQASLCLRNPTVSEEGRCNSYYLCRRDDSPSLICDASLLGGFTPVLPMPGRFCGINPNVITESFAWYWWYFEAIHTPGTPLGLRLNLRLSVLQLQSHDLMLQAHALLHACWTNNNAGTDLVHRGETTYNALGIDCTACQVVTLDPTSIVSPIIQGNTFWQSGTDPTDLLNLPPTITLCPGDCQ